jgi:thiamine pyrophosphokinase
MTRAFIFANGKMDTPPALLAGIQPSDLIIAADGGAHHCRSIGLVPLVIIGDLDSLVESDVSYYHSVGTEIIKFPAQKDETDLELALRLVDERGVSQVFIIGGMGARWDMTIANVMLAAHPQFSGLSISLLDGNDILSVMHGGGRSDFYGQYGNSLSLIPLGGDAEGITTNGVRYPLVNETLFFGSPRGVSNVIINDSAWVSLRRGRLLCCVSNREEM